MVCQTNALNAMNVAMCTEHDSDSYNDEKANDDQKWESLIKCR